jgi:antitoxin PrlF
MLVTDKGQVTIPKHIRAAAGVVPGSEVSFSLEGSKIVITPVAGSVKNDRRAKLRTDEIMAFLRADNEAPARARRGRP